MKKLIFIILIILILPLVYQSTPTEILKLKTFDTFVKKYEPSNNFVILNITEQDVEDEGGYPFPRRRLAEIQIELINKGALGIGWVMSFPQADRMGGDEVFATTLGYAPSVIAMFEDGKGNYPKFTGTVVKGNDIGGMISTGVKENLNTLANNTLQGLAIAPTDIDQLVRRIPLLVRTPNNEWIPSFGTQIYKALFNVKTYIIKTNDNGIEEISIRGIPPIPTDSLGRKWISWIDTPQTNLKEMDVEGKFVFVGVTANGVMPQIATPNGLMEPHKIQAALAESLLVQDSPTIPDWSLAAELLIFTVFVTLTWLVLNWFGITLGISIATFIMLCTALGGYYLIQKGILIDVTWTLISEFIAGSIAFYLRFREQFKLRQQVKKQFGKYLDPRMVKKLQDNPELCKVNGNRVDCSIIFTDLRGFTSLSESVEPEMVTYIMNHVLDVQVKAVNKYLGCTDKFIGDAGMFHWNTIIPQDDHHNLALQAAKEIEKNIDQLNIKFKSESIPEIAIGIGVNSGICIAGNFGATDRFAFSLIGDPCNVAARLESSTKVAGVGILIGEETAKKSKFKLKLLEPIEVKGKSKPLQVYTWGSDE
jgi:adenylate cyclase